MYFKRFIKALRADVTYLRAIQLTVLLSLQSFSFLLLTRSETILLRGMTCFSLIGTWTRYTSSNLLLTQLFKLIVQQLLLRARDHRHSHTSWYNVLHIIFLTITFIKHLIVFLGVLRWFSFCRLITRRRLI